MDHILNTIMKAYKISKSLKPLLYYYYKYLYINYFTKHLKE